MEKISPENMHPELKKWKLPPVIKKAVSVISAKKGERVIILKLKGLTDLTDFMIICNGRSQKQNKAISDDIQRQVKKEFKSAPLGVEGTQYGDWILLDYVDFIIHIFSPEMRGKFSLEKLWMDAKRYDLIETE
jgi:ribosome-associated protein